MNGLRQRSRIAPYRHLSSCYIIPTPFGHSSFRKGTVAKTYTHTRTVYHTRGRSPCRYPKPYRLEPRGVLLAARLSEANGSVHPSRKRTILHPVTTEW